MPLDLVNFFRPARLFHLQPAIATTTIYFLLVVFGSLLIASVVIKIWQKKNKGDAFFQKLLAKYFTMLTTLGVIGIVLTWFRYERVYMFSSRLLLFVWFIGFVVWFIFILRYQIKTIPPSRDQLKKTREFNKYLPKRK